MKYEIAKKQELFPADLTNISGGSQVEINNTIKHNKKPVKIGSTIIINMLLEMKIK